LAASGLTLSLCGCAPHGAPSFVLFGAYFPGWMLCALLGIVAAIATRALMVSTGLSAILPFQLLVCASIGAVVAIALWLLWFGR
jgi:uncharacterized membrane protein YeaQ/YmgE (transglycosylase-associated protein family)